LIPEFKKELGESNDEKMRGLSLEVSGSNFNKINYEIKHQAFFQAS
jgi:hypothetical protein